MGYEHRNHSQLPQITINHGDPFVLSEPDGSVITYTHVVKFALLFDAESLNRRGRYACAPMPSSVMQRLPSRSMPPLVLKPVSNLQHSSPCFTRSFVRLIVTRISF